MRGAFLCARSDDEAKKESLEDKREHLQIVISMKKTRESPEARLYFQKEGSRVRHTAFARPQTSLLTVRAELNFGVLMGSGVASAL